MIYHMYQNIFSKVISGCLDLIVKKTNLVTVIDPNSNIQEKFRDKIIRLKQDNKGSALNILSKALK